MNKVLFVVGLNKNGGAEKRAKYIASLIKDEFNSIIFAFAGDQDVDFAFAKTYQEYKAQSKHNRINYLANIIKQEKPDVIFSFLPHINYFTVKAIKKSHIKGIKHIIAIVHYKFKFVNKLLLRYSIARSDYIYYQCEEQKRFIKSSKPSFVLANPVNVSCFKEREMFNKFISVGRLEDQKDYNLMIDAFSEIHKSDKKAILDIFGNGSQKELLIKKINNLGLSDVINIHEYTDNINKEYESHDVFLFTTKAEGFPNALAEAMANSLICFTTHFQTGCDELITNEVTGYICNNRDPKKYADLVNDKLGDPIKLRQIAKNGYDHTREVCSATTFSQNIKSIIENMITK